MQLIWISGSTSHIRRINITKTGLIKLSAVVCFVCVLIGAGLHFLGFRIAVQVRPDLAREMGGVITQQEKEEIENAYRTRLEAMQAQLTRVGDQISKLQTLKDRFTELATPVPVRHKLSETDGGKGGPYIPIDFGAQRKNGTLAKDLDSALKSGQTLVQLTERLEQDWQRQYLWLSRLPTALPIASFATQSSYGPRIDPITKRIAQHPGVDFSAPPGTSIYAAGNGVVHRVETDRAYGLFVEIKHADGFITKYAHTRKINVQPGQAVSRGDVIAEVGNSGRSTGPHLHYEVTFNGNLINPVQVMASRNSKQSSDKD
ncbi:MAG: M23 family metallopeptidase [Polynucleobacter sp.]